MIDHKNRTIDYMRISVTELCNYRCRYCMPENGICKKNHSEMLTEDEMIQAITVAAELGIRKLRITGGEPLVKRNILSICERAAKIDGIQELCLTTNGTMLPQYAKKLKEVGVNRLNISLDTLNPEKFHYITRCGEFHQTWDGIMSALDAGFDKIKLNAVLIGGFNDDEIRPLAELTKKYPLDMRFIEMMPMYDGGEFSESSFLPYQTVLDALPECTPITQDGGVAKLYRLPNALGNIGLISPVSAHFCDSCNRIRLTSDGKLKPCLHSSEEITLRGLSKEQMKETMYNTIYNKPAWHGELSATQRSRAGRNMNQIGG